MSLKKLRKRMGCLMLTGAMIFAGSHTALAAEYKANLQQSDLSRESNHSEVGGDKETEPPTEQSESHSESESERQTESETHTSDQEETKVAIDVETETETPTESEPVTDETEEPTSDTEKPNGDDSGDKEKVPQIVDRNDPKDELEQIDHPGREDGQEDHSDANANLTTNIIAGNGIYLSELSGTYYLTFEDHFSKVMDEIEKDFKQWLDKPEQFIARNWQDVLAVYVLRTRETTGNRQITLDQGAKEELEKIFFLMNIRGDSSIAKKLSKEVDLDAEICPLTVKDYAELKNLGAEEKEILDKYTTAECKKLCAVITAAKGFVRGEAGPGVSEERVSIVAAACSLVGKVGYFWGGKSYAIGWDSLWGEPMTVTAGGSKSTGRSRGFGLDCSGFVCWSFYNGLGGTDGGIGNHTTSQWNASEMVESKDAQPGDLVFYDSPEAGDQNHVGLVIGKNADGSLLVAHCSSSRNGVVVGEAWSSGFKYVRRVMSLN